VTDSCHILVSRIPALVYPAIYRTRLPLLVFTERSCSMFWIWSTWSRAGVSKSNFSEGQMRT